MANYGFSAHIPYGTESFPVDGVQYCEWEDSIEKCKTDEEVEWATYDYLISRGYFVSKPKSTKPATAGRPAGVVTGYETIPPIETPRETAYIAPEPAWTPSKILAERDKLLRERERIQAVKEQAFHAKMFQMYQNQEYNRVDLKFRNPDGSEYTVGDWIKVGIGLVITFAILGLAAKVG